MIKILKSIMKKILKRTNWRIKKIYKNKAYINKQPNLELVKAILSCNGIIHMGGHRGQEAPIYDWFNKKTIWVEANPNILDDLIDNVGLYTNQIVIHALLSDKDKEIVEFNLSSNDGASSSLFKFGKDDLHSAVKMRSSIKLETTKLDSMVKDRNININEYDFWVMDLQGAELLTLRGSTNSLINCKFIYSEISQEDVYDKGAQWWELKKFLNTHGFNPAWEPEEMHTDVLFIKKI